MTRRLGGHLVLVVLLALLCGALAPLAPAGFVAPATAATPVTIDQTTLPNSAAGTPRSTTITASGGTAPYAFAVTAGTLPPGLTLSADGTLSGTPTESNQFDFTITATDSGGQTGSQAYQVFISFPNFSMGPAPVAGTVGVPYSHTVIAGGGNPPYTWGRFSGMLPPGITMSGGVLSGTPTAAGVFNFALVARDTTTGPGSPFGVASGYTISVAPPTLELGPATVPDATVGAAYSQTLTTTGGTAPYTYDVTAGALPAGLALSAGGALTGTPTAVGTFDFTVTATDSTGGTGPFSTSRAYTLVVGPPTVTLTPASVPGGTYGQAYDQRLSAAGGTGPYSYSLSAGTLPPGLLLDPDGRIHGTPTAHGSATFTVTAQDSTTGTGAPFTATRSYTLTIAPVIVVSPPSVPAATVGQPYDQSIAASGGTGPYAYAVTGGALPAGLLLDPGDGRLHGTPRASGSFTYTVTATDDRGYPGSRTYTLTVAAPTITVSPASLAGATVGAAYSQSITASGGTSPYTFAVTAGALPAGLTLAADGTLAGTPTAGGTFNLTVTATDSTTGAGAPFTASRAYTLTVGAPTITLGPATLAGGSTGRSYVQTLTATGGTAPYAFTVTAGALPPGLSLATDGRLTGWPTATGDFSFSVTARDSSSGGPYSATRAYSLNIRTGRIVPFLLGEPSDTKAVAGSDVVLHAAAVGTPDPTVTWETDTGTGWRPVPGAMSADLILADVPLTLNGARYRAVFTNDAGTVTTRAATLSVGTVPVVTTHPADVALRTGADGRLLAAASGSPAPSVQWQVQRDGAWTDLAGATDTTLPLSDVTLDQDGTRYRAVFSNGYGEPAATRPATLTVTSPLAVSVAPRVSRNPTDRSVRAGHRVVFRAAATGRPVPEVQWQVRIKHRWRDIDAATRGRLVLTQARRSWDGRSYRAVFTNAAGSVTTTAAELHVRHPRGR